MAVEILLTLKQPYWLKTMLGVFALILVYSGYSAITNVQAEYLSTDLLIFFLVCCLIFFVAYIRKQPHLNEPWKKVFQNKIAMSSVVVLLFFVVVGLMDSIHFRKADSRLSSKDKPVYSVEMVSLLDVSLDYIRHNTETTYSSPLSLYSYAKENFVDENGVKYRDFPRLKYAGSHIEKPGQQYWNDIIAKSLYSLFISSILIALFLLLVLWRLKDKSNSLTGLFIKIIRNELSLPWHIMIVTVMVLIILGSWLFYMSHYYHVMGTDKVGQDVFYLTLKSIRTGLVIGTLTTLIMLPFAIALGVMAGYYKGVIDDIIQYIYTTLNSIPGILLIVAVMLAIDVYIENHSELFETAIERADIKLLALCAVLGITSWTGLCRLLRGEVFKLRELEYIQAARSLGVANIKIITSHIIPNVMHIVLIVVVLDFSGLVLAEAILAYIGVGVDPSTISWGNMINSARLELAREPVVWWSLISAFSFMFALVLAANLFSDAIRDAFDPRMQGIK